MRLRRAKPRVARRLAPVAWLLWSGAAVVVLAASAGVLTLQLSALDQRSYPGRLRPMTDLAGVALPADIPLQTVLVAEGDQVRAGQTLATLDADALAIRLGALDLDILERQVLRDCLIDGAGLDAQGRPDAGALPPMPTTAPDASTDMAADDQRRDLRVRLRGALADCAVDRRGLAERRRGLDEAHALLVERRDLLSKRIALALATSPAPLAAPDAPSVSVPLRPAAPSRPTTPSRTVPLRPHSQALAAQTQPLSPGRVPLQLAERTVPLTLAPPPPTPQAAPAPAPPSRLHILPEGAAAPDAGSPSADPTSRAQNVVALALARSVLEERLLDLRRQAETETLRAERALLDKSYALGEEVRELRALRSLLARYSAAPRLVAPQAGTVLRIRATRPGVVFPETAELIALAPLGDPRFEAMVIVPPTEARQLRPGDPVTVRLPSQLSAGTALTGQIGAPTPLPAHLGGLDRVAVSVELDRPGALAEIGEGLALHGRGTTAAIQIRLPEVPLVQTLQRRGLSLAQYTWLGRTWLQPPDVAAHSQQMAQMPSRPKPAPADTQWDEVGP